MINRTTTSSLLLELNAALSAEGAEPADWIICGGTALAIHGVVQRTTLDIDVIGGWSAATLQVVQLALFPVAVERAIERVAIGHPELQAAGRRWVNLGPRALLMFGLPPGCTGRLRGLCIGTHLTIRLPDRRDLIAFKLFAAVDGAQGRQAVHKRDLGSFAPSDEELRFAIDWVLTIPDPNHQLRAELREFLQESGHEDLAYYIA